MDFISFTAGADDNGRRLDRVLRRLLPEENLPGIYKSLRKGIIKLNDRKAEPGTKVASGDSISVAAFLADKIQETPLIIHMQNPCIDFSSITLFSNTYICVINKPYDVAVQGGTGSLAEAYAGYWKQNRNNGKSSSLSFRAGPLHRLDRKTTGLLVLSNNLQGAQWFTGAVAEHQIGKRYIALVQGTIKSRQDWTDSIESEQDISPAEFHTVCISDSGGRSAMTTVQPLSYGTYSGLDITLAEYAISTGRKHQIRAQSASHGFPLLGDTAYGGIQIHEDCDFYLHARELSVPENNPIQMPVKITAPISTNFQKMLNKTLINWNGLLII